MALAESGASRAIFRIRTWQMAVRPARRKMPPTSVNVRQATGALAASRRPPRTCTQSAIKPSPQVAGAMGQAQEQTPWQLDGQHECRPEWQWAHQRVVDHHGALSALTCGGATMRTAHVHDEPPVGVSFHDAPPPQTGMPGPHGRPHKRAAKRKASRAGPRHKAPARTCLLQWRMGPWGRAPGSVDQ